MEEINIVLSSDNKFAQHLGVTVCSILENKEEDYKLIFNILDGGISKDNILKIRSLISNYKNVKINFYRIDEDLFDNLPKLGESLATYYRLLIPQILSQKLEKVIYLDCDIVVNLDIKKLYDIDIDSYFLAAAEHNDRQLSEKELIEIKDRLNLDGKSKYFNMGVLLINLTKWRINNSCDNLLRYASQNHDKLYFWDQDVLNFVFQDKIITLDEKFNYMPDEYFYENFNNKIIHFTNITKPWHYRYIGNGKEHYFRYLRITPWRNFEYQDKDFFNIFKKCCKLIFPRYFVIIYGKVKRFILKIV